MLVKTSIQEVQQFISPAFSHLIFLCFFKLQKNLQRNKREKSRFKITTNHDRIKKKTRNSHINTFLPDTALRRTPSSLSRPKNCIKYKGVSNINNNRSKSTEFLEQKPWKAARDCCSSHHAASI